MGFLGWKTNEEKAIAESYYLEIADQLARAKIRLSFARNHANHCAELCHKAETVYGDIAAQVWDLEKRMRDLK